MAADLCRQFRSLYDHDDSLESVTPFSRLWSLHHRSVYQGCLTWLSGHRDDADEAYSRVAIRALEKWPAAFHDDEHARAWLLTLARNVCMDLHRERRRGREVSIDAEPHTVEQTAAADPESTYLLDERDRHLRALVKGLPPRLRRTVELHVFHELKYEDVARELGISVANVRKRMQEVRQRMRDEIEHGIHPSPGGDADTEIAEKIADARVLATVQAHTPDLDERDVTLVLPFAGRSDGAYIAALERYCGKHPRGWRRRLDLARALVAAGRLDDAVTHYRYVAERQPFPIEHWLELGGALDAAGRRSEAAATHDRGGAEAGREPARQHLRALAAALRRDVNDARELLALAADADPDDARHARAYGAICLDAGRPLEAVTALERAIDVDPADPLTPSLLHDALVDAGRPAAALERIAAAVDADPANVPALERYIARRAPGSELADELLPVLLQLAPARASAQAVAARVALLRGRPAEAEARLLLYQQGHARHAGAWLALAEFHLATGQTRVALETALQALTLRPDDRAIWLELCRILPIAGDADESQRAAGEIRARFPDDAMLLGAAGTVAVAAEDRALALELGAQATSMQPDVVSLRLRHASVLADSRKYDEATGELAVAWTLLPPDDGHADAVHVALLLSRLHAHLGTTNLSVAWANIAAERCDALAPMDCATALALHGAASELLGDTRRACEDYRAALQHHLLHPRRGRVLDALRRLDG